MKHTRVFFALLVLAAAVLAFGCNQPADSGTPDGNNVTLVPFTMNEKQEVYYDSIIPIIQLKVLFADLQASDVKSLIDEKNETAATFKFKIVDTATGTPVKRFTTEEDLKARFKPQPL